MTTDNFPEASSMAEIEYCKILAEEQAQEMADSFDIYDDDEADRLFQVLLNLFKISFISEGYTKHLENHCNTLEDSVEDYKAIIRALYEDKGLPPAFRAVLKPLADSDLI